MGKEGSRRSHDSNDEGKVLCFSQWEPHSWQSVKSFYQRQSTQEKAIPFSSHLGSRTCDLHCCIGINSQDLTRQLSQQLMPIQQCKPQIHWYLWMTKHCMHLVVLKEVQHTVLTKHQ
ncbi:hypothetical protein ABBQ38_001733 [Trebouxia sp. C0009 RCD-2024]